MACTYIDLDTHLKCKLDSWLSASRTGGPKLRFRTSLPWIFGASYLNQISSSLEMMEENAINMDALTAELLIESALLPISIDIEKISSKILFISGKEDILTPGSELKKNIKDKKHCEFVTVPGGHACFYEYPSESLVSIRPFFMEHLNKTMLTQGKGDDLHALA